MKSKSYEEFVEKFKPKLTTDDCFTPPLVYEAVKSWVCQEYGISPETIIRPFWPGADYKAVDYPDDCIVLDNPPFSIFSKICEFYLDNGVRFFLFSPSLTTLGGRNVVMRMNHIVCDADITYENGAVVKTAFVTNLGDGETILQTAPTLGRAVSEAVDQAKKETVKELPKYTYPYHIVTAAMLQRYSHYGIDFCVKKSDCTFIRALDQQKENRKEIFGGGLLLSERAAAERAAAHVWELSDKERKIVASLGKTEDGACLNA